MIFLKKERELKSFLNPKSVAIIGASENLGKVGGILVDKLKTFSGEKILVNPNRDSIFGLKCYKSILDYKKNIDLVLIAIPKEFVLSSLKECVKKKIKNVIIISAGFSEIGDKKSEEKILKISRGNKMNILGPNCFGISVPFLGLDTTFSNTSCKEGNTAFISQSGALFSYVSDIKKLGFSYFISLGNMADLSFEDFLPFLIEDKKTKKIVLYVEKLKNGRKFIEVCKKSKKEIVVVKVGSSSKGSQAAISHTGSLATDYNIYRGIFKQAGIFQEETIEDAFNLPKIKKKFNAISPTIITNAGGAGGLLADGLERAGISLSIPPVDILGTATAQDYKNAIYSVKKGSTIFLILTPQRMSQIDETAKIILENKSSWNFICFFLGEGSVKNANEILKKGGVLVYNNL